MEYIVETKHLTKSFGKEKAVSNLEMKIPKGEIYGFLGQMELEKQQPSACCWG